MTNPLTLTSTLVFPALNQAAFDYCDAACLHGEHTIAAASVHDHEATARLGHLTLLPNIYDARFRSEFFALIEEKNIDRVYCPVASVHAYMKQMILDEVLPIKIVGKSPISQQVETYRELLAKAREESHFIRQCAGDDVSVLSDDEIAATHRQAGQIYGESNSTKLSALMAIFPSAPKGDVVEIGSLMGRSLFVLLFLAQRYRVGPVLSIDPFSLQANIQENSPDVIRNVLVNQWDYDILPIAFSINMIPFSRGDLNYLRMTSAEGFNTYCRLRVINSKTFGNVSYEGKIAVIHIDGNHDFDQVNLDCKLWLCRLVPGAWVIIDDYIWAHGDGPHRVGDALLRERWHDIERAFVCGKALFIQFK